MIRAALLLASLLAALLAAPAGAQEDGTGPHWWGPQGAPKGAQLEEGLGLLRLMPDEGAAALLGRMLLVGPGESCGDGGALPLAAGQPRAMDGQWGCLILRNVGEERGIWRIVERNVGPEMTFYDTRGRVSPVILDRRMFAPVAERRSGTPALVSEPIVLGPGEEAEIEVQVFAPEGFDPDALDLVTDRRLSQERMRDAVLEEGLLAAVAVLVLYFAAYGVVLRSRPALWYAVAFALMGLGRAALDGQLVYWVAPSSPYAMGWLAPICLVGMALAYAGFVVSFARGTGARGPRWTLWLGVPAALTAAIALMVFAGGELGQTGRVIAVGVLLLLPLSALMGIVQGVSAMRRGADGAALFTLGAAIFAAAQTLAWSTPLLGTAGVRSWSWVGAGQLLDGLVFAAALIRQTIALRGQRDEALRAELAASREAADLGARLLAARDDADEARALADARRARLAATSHDLRQPLQSLRLSLEEARAEAPALSGRLETALGYLDGVLGSAMEEARPGSETQPEEEALPLSVVIGNAARMFSAEASGKGLELRAAPTALAVRADPVALIRATANLTANALRYTGSGGVLIGARPRDGGVALEVWDTGPGLTEEEIARILRPYERGGTGEGEGLGLASTAALAEEMGARLAVRSRPGRGSVFAIEGLARAAPPAAGRDGTSQKGGASPAPSLEHARAGAT